MRPLEIVVKFLSYDGTLTNDPKDSDKIENRVQEEDVAGISRYKNIILDATTDQVIALPDPNSEYLLIFTDREISIKLDGGSEIHVLKPRANGVKTFVFYQKGTITGLSVSNASSGDANVDIISVNK